MESLGKLIETGRLCRLLRTKTMFYQSDDVSAAAPELRGPYWCSRTQGIYGPDDQLVEPEQCKPGRGCCEAG
ncbi:MAG: hypothetical protein KGL59_14370 [Acidobacteriota bacterium]|nr:hypothetical protein [Acidobacteriota bacterium]